MGLSSKSNNNDITTITGTIVFVTSKTPQYHFSSREWTDLAHPGQLNKKLQKILNSHPKTENFYISFLPINRNL